METPITGVGVVYVEVFAGWRRGEEPPHPFKGIQYLVRTFLDPNRVST
jgi:hypothetical protein